jgi:tetratricopeptide (TPR) repeat protein
VRKARGGGGPERAITASDSRLAIEDVLNLLERLVEKSLVVVHDHGGEARYGMLETIREYALDRLRGCGEADGVARRHAEVFLALAEEAGPRLYGEESVPWLGRLDAEHENLRAAHARLLESDPEGCLRLARALANYWLVRGHLTEGRQRLEAALGRSSAEPCVPPRLRVRSLVAAADFARQQGDVAAARTHLNEALSIARATDDRPQIAGSTLTLAKVARIQGDLAAARAYLGESLAIASDLGDDYFIDDALSNLGEVARQEGDWATARALHTRALAVSRRLGAQESTSTNLCNLGAVACEEGDLQSASACYREALTIDRALGNRAGASYSLDGLGAVAAKRRECERAAHLAGAAEALRASMGYELEPADRGFRERYLADLREWLGDEAFEAAAAEGRAMTLERAIELALSS